MGEFTESIESMPMKYQGEERRSMQDWHLNKSFSIGIIIAIFTQCLTFGWYASKVDSRISDNTAKIEELRIWKEKEDYANMMEASHFATVDEKLSELKDSTDRIVNILQKGERR